MDSKWWQKEVVYQIYPRSFKDTNDDGIGDINGITLQLDKLKDLGITMIWICPIYKSPMIDNGYDISDYYKLNPEFGTLEDLTNLIIEAKQRNIKIILDLVINHTSNEHPWFKAALKDSHSKYRNYYIFKHGNGGNKPNNWRSLFGGSAWEKLPNENTYYLHVFHKKQPDLNWENKEMRENIYKMINWWLDKGISGFRIDSITFIKKDQDYSSVSSDGPDGLASITRKSRNRPGIEKFLKELRKRTFDNYNCVTIGEAPGVPYKQYGDYVGKDGYFSMIFDFHYVDIDVENGSEWWKRADWKVNDLKQLIFKSQKVLQKFGWSANFLENHDQPRSVSKFIKDPNFQNEIGAKAIGAMYFFLRGTPFIYQGEELGMLNANRKNIDDFDDISSLDNYKRAMLAGFSSKEALKFVNLRSRDNTRSPYPWSSEKYADFSVTKPWISLSGKEKEINYRDQKEDKNSVLEFYKKMIALRNESEYSGALTNGCFAEIKDVPDSVIAYQRDEKTQIDSYTNLSSKKVSFKAARFNKTILNNYFDIEKENDQIVLKPYQTILVERM